MTKSKIYKEFAWLKRLLKREIIKVDQEDIDHYHRRKYLVYKEEVQELIKELNNKDNKTKTDKYQEWLMYSKLGKAEDKIDQFLGLV